MDEDAETDDALPVPAHVMEAAQRVIDGWCNNCAYDRMPLGSGWDVESYEVDY